jgi:hypothetical protein
MENYSKEVAKIGLEEKQQMYTILSKYFLGTSFDEFLHDLSQKEVVIFIAKEGEIMGFSTLVCSLVTVEGADVPVIFSGDTIVEKEHRNSSGLGIEMANYFNRMRERFADRTVYYLLCTKGWRTYKVLPFFFNTFYPRVDREMPLHLKKVRDSFCQQKYKNQYDAKRGLIIAEGNPQRIRSENFYDSAHPARESGDIDFFFEQNPNYLNGTELVCIASIDEENITKRFKRLSR